MIKDLLITPLNIIDTPGGNVMHAMKGSDPGFVKFGEAYFSKVNPFEIKAWKRHKEMTLNLVVPQGKIRFVFCDLHLIMKSPALPCLATLINS